MLSPIIKSLLEAKLGKELRYPYDIEHLCYDIEKHTNQRISVNTLKRLLGLIKGVKEPRLYTLDTIAGYLDYRNWDDLISHLNNTGNSEFYSIGGVDLSALNQGDKISFSYVPDREVTIEYVEANKLIITVQLSR